RARPSEPRRVGIAQKERRSADLRRRFGNAAASAEKPVAFVGDENARMPPPRQMPFDGIGQMMHIDDSELDAGFGQPIEAVIDERLAANGDQRLWHMPVIRPHTRAKPRRQYDRALRHHAAPNPHGAQSPRAPNTVYLRTILSENRFPPPDQVRGQAFFGIMHQPRIAAS